MVDVPPPPPSPPPPPPALVAAQLSGESPPPFVWQSGASGEFRMPESIGGGVALLDADRDGDLDIFFAQGGDIAAPESHRCVLWRNDGSWSFTDVTAASGAALPGYAMGVAAGDIDGDGDVDLAVARLGAVDVLRNESTPQEGILYRAMPAMGVQAGAWPSVIHLSDVDADGDLDLFVGRYLEWTPGAEPPCEGPDGRRDYCSPRSFSAPASSSLYMNDGRGEFAHALGSGIDGGKGAALGAIAADFTGDGRRDIFVANDAFPNHLWVQQADGTFADEASARGCAVDLEGRAKAGMGVGCEDIDGNGWLDLLVCNLDGESDSLFVNQSGRFVDATAKAGLRGPTRRATRFGLLLADFDEDGALDILEACGRVSRDPRAAATAGAQAQPQPQAGAVTAADPYAQPPLLLMGTSGSLRWTASGGIPAIGPATGRGAAMGDLDGDGDLDAVIVNRDAPATFLRNAGDGTSGVTIEPRLATGAPALDAIVEIRCAGAGAAGGEAVQRRLVQSGRSYFAASAPVARFGLADGVSVARVLVRWPDGTSTELDGAACGASPGATAVVTQPSVR